MKLYLLPLLLGVNIAYSAEKSDKFSLRENEGTNLQSQALLNTLSPRVSTSRSRESNRFYWKDLNTILHNEHMYNQISEFSDTQLNSISSYPSQRYPLEMAVDLNQPRTFEALLNAGANPNLCNNLEGRIREHPNALKQQREDILNPNEHLFHRCLKVNYALGDVMRTFSQEEKNIVFSARNIHDISNSNLSEEKKSEVIQAINAEIQDHAKYLGFKISKSQEMLDILHTYQRK